MLSDESGNQDTWSACSPLIHRLAMNMSMNTPGLVETENLISKRGKITPAVMALTSGAFSADSNDISRIDLALANPFNQM